MKKLMTVLLGLSMVLGTATMFAQTGATKAKSTKAAKTKAPKKSTKS